MYSSQYECVLLRIKRVYSFILSQTNKAYLFIFKFMYTWIVDARFHHFHFLMFSVNRLIHIELNESPLFIFARNNYYIIILELKMNKNRRKMCCARICVSSCVCMFCFSELPQLQTFKCINCFYSQCRTSIHHRAYNT